MPQTRREFLKTTAAATAALALPAGVFAQAKAPDIAAVKGDKVAATRKAVEMMGGMKRYVPDGARVVIKPNVGFARTPDIGATTSPEVMAELAKMAVEAGARKVLILDFPVHQARLCLDRSGIEEACSGLPKTSVFPIDDKKFFTDVEVGGRDLKRARIAKDVLEADVFINAPTAKSHGGAIVSLGLKNHMGLIYDRRYFHVTGDLHYCIADLATVVKPHLIVCDASRILTDGGPQGPGGLKHERTIVAGTAQATVDAFVCGMSTWDGRRYTPEQIPHIRRAAELGLGSIDPKAWTVARAAV